MKKPQRFHISMTKALFMHAGFSIPCLPLNHAIIKHPGYWWNSQFNPLRSIPGHGSTIQAVSTGLCPYLPLWETKTFAMTQTTTANTAFSRSSFKGCEACGAQEKIKKPLWVRQIHTRELRKLQITAQPWQEEAECIAFTVLSSFPSESVSPSTFHWHAGQFPLAQMFF